MASMQSASARQLPGCSTTGRSHAHAQRLNYSHTVLRQLQPRAFSSSSFSSTCKDLKRCLPPKRRQACSVQTRAESSPNQEEAQLRADYGALSQRLEVNFTARLRWSVLALLVLPCPLLSLGHYGCTAVLVHCAHSLILVHSSTNSRDCRHVPHEIVLSVLFHELLLRG